MAKDDTDRIEREIEIARTRLATTLDELAVRADPQRIADDTKNMVVAKLNEPKVKYTLIGAGALVAGSDGNRVFIENGRFHGTTVVKAILARGEARAAAAP